MQPERKDHRPDRKVEDGFQIGRKNTGLASYKSATTRPRKTEQIRARVAPYTRASV